MWEPLSERNIFIAKASKMLNLNGTIHSGTFVYVGADKNWEGPALGLNVETRTNGCGS